MKPKRGRPSGFEPWMCDAIIEVAKEGGHIAAMCVKIGLESEETFHEWKKKHPQFEKAYNRSKIYSKAFYEDLLLQITTGKIPYANMKGLEVTLHNKFSEEYKMRSPGGINIEANTTINALNVELSQEQIEYKIAQKLDALKGLGVDVLEYQGNVTIDATPEEEEDNDNQ